MSLKRMNLINTSNPDVFRKQFSDDDKLQDVLDKVNNDEIRFSQWKRVSVEKGGKLTNKIKLAMLCNRPSNTQKTLRLISSY